jgi:hypothetical protein
MKFWLESGLFRKMLWGLLIGKFAGGLVITKPSHAGLLDELLQKTGALSASYRSSWPAQRLKVGQRKQAAEGQRLHCLLTSGQANMTCKHRNRLLFCIFCSKNGMQTANLGLIADIFC